MKWFKYTKDVLLNNDDKFIMRNSSNEYFYCYIGTKKSIDCIRDANTDEFISFLDDITHYAHIINPITGLKESF